MKVALLVSDGFETTSEKSSDQSFQLFNAGTKTFTGDRVTRKVFSTSININSKVP